MHFSRCFLVQSFQELSVSADTFLYDRSNVYRFSTPISKPTLHIIFLFWKHMTHINSSSELSPETSALITRLRNTYVEIIKQTNYKNNLTVELSRIKMDIRLAKDYEDSSEDTINCLQNEYNELLLELENIETQIEFNECLCRKLESHFRCLTEDFETLE